ncbi:hypothetical protein [Coleofasciculus sp. G2-EDA-02]|uniref:hypothetical protein n=1 Tax=Coleofasciculus sp. G2-EDA-02 TaxID=3069529 RepID=UPI0032FED1B0
MVTFAQIIDRKYVTIFVDTPVPLGITPTQKDAVKRQDMLAVHGAGFVVMSGYLLIRVSLR